MSGKETRSAYASVRKVARRMSEMLNAICAGLNRLRRTTTVDRLRPGIPASRFGAVLEELGLRPPPDLASVYEWHDGTDATAGALLDDLHLFPGFYFLTLNDAVANYRSFRDDKRWDTSWFPVFANGGGDFLVVVCKAGHRDWGKIVHFRIDESDHPVEFSSTEALLTTVAAAYKDGVYYVDARGYL